jgi:hypothetical protein
VNERRGEEAERYGEMYGAPLGTRLAETSNYCALAITADDALTQRIIEKDELIAEECSEFYEHFIRLVEHIQEAPPCVDSGRSEGDRAAGTGRDPRLYACAQNELLRPEGFRVGR